MTEFSDEDLEDAMCCASSQLRDFWAELPPEDRTKQEISCFITFCMAECLLWHQEDRYDVLCEFIDKEMKVSGLEGKVSRRERIDDEILRRAKDKFDEWQLQKICPMQKTLLKDRRVVEFIDGKFKEVA